MEELEDLEALKEMTEYSTMNNIEIVCYAKLHDLITEDKMISDISKAEFLMILAQINASISFFYDTGYASPQSLRSIYKKLKVLFRDELKKRKEIRY